MPHNEVPPWEHEVKVEVPTRPRPSPNTIEIAARTLARYFMILAMVAGVLVVLGGILFGLALLTTSNTREARRAEGEEIMGSVRNAVRAYFSRTNTIPATTTDAGVTDVERTGQYYFVHDKVTTTDLGLRDHGLGTLECSPQSANSSDGHGKMTFDWASGSSQMEWDPK